MAFASVPSHAGKVVLRRPYVPGVLVLHERHHMHKLLIVMGSHPAERPGHLFFVCSYVIIPTLTSFLDINTTIVHLPVISVREAMLLCRQSCTGSNSMSCTYAQCCGSLSARVTACCRHGYVVQHCTVV